MKKYFIAGNWKMNMNLAEASEVAGSVVREIAGLNLSENVTVAICPPFTNLTAVETVIRGSAVRLGAQHCHAEKKGAFTGEISAEMLRSVGCQYVILGHSERRRYFGETNNHINKRINAAMNEGLIPIYCVGETLEERQKGITIEVVREQILEGLFAIEIENPRSLVIAYEPVWAIGTGLAATAEQAQEVHAMIRSLLIALYPDFGAEMMILYGGSMTADNAQELLAKADINGGLIGGASLKAESFAGIVCAAHQA